MQKDIYSGSHKEKSANKNRKKKTYTAAVLLLVFILTTGMLVAKYISERNSNGLVRANNFYFTSSLLDGKSHTLAPGSTSLTFTLGNHEDDLRFSEMNIDYEVTVDNAAVKIENGTGRIEKGAVNDAEVTISDLQAGTYIITAVGKGGYSKTLTATIVVPEKETQIYQYQDTTADEYILLTVWNEGDKPGTATITYTGAPDNTNPDMTSWQTNGQQEVTIEPHESKTFRFFGGTVSVTGAAEKEPY